MKKIFIAGLMSLVLMSCSSPQTILLDDGSVIKTKDEPTFNKRTKYYEYEDLEGNRGSVNSKRVKLIQPEGAELPEAVEPVEEPVKEVIVEPTVLPEKEAVTETAEEEVEVVE